MPRRDTPSSVMYAALKSFGIGNQEAATQLLDGRLTFDGRMLQDRIDESSQLSRRIVHTAPGELPVGLFVNFYISVPQLFERAVEKITIHSCAGHREEAVNKLTQAISTEWFDRMVDSLLANNIDPVLYRNIASYIELADGSNTDRALLRFMQFVVTGCLGNPRTASIHVVSYATDMLGIDFHTAQTVISAADKYDYAETDLVYSLVRVIDGKIHAGANIHVLNPEGTEIGFLPEARHFVADVDADVSRRHALIWREDDRWFICDLGSTNGTCVISGASGEEIVVGTDPDKAVELHPTDIVRLGSTTSFMVLPTLG